MNGAFGGEAMRICLAFVCFILCIPLFGCGSEDADGTSSTQFASSDAFLLLSDNGGEKITEEMNGREVRRLLHQIAGPLIDGLTVTVKRDELVGNVHIECEWAGDGPDTFVSQVIYEYVVTRAEGHSCRYAKELLQEKYVRGSTRDARDDKDAIVQRFPRVLKTWLTEHAFEELRSYVRDGKTHNCYMLIDGSLAWVYTLRKEADGQVRTYPKTSC